MTVGHVGIGPDIAFAKDIQATFLIAPLLIHALKLLSALPCFLGQGIRNKRTNRFLLTQE